MYRRRQIRNTVAGLWALTRSAYGLGSLVAWGVASTVLVVVLPLGVELEYEAAAVAWENEVNAQQQQVKLNVLAIRTMALCLGA